MRGPITKHSVLALALCLSLVASACGYSELLRRYETREHVPETVPVVQYAHLSAFVTPAPPPPSSRAFLELNPGAQERLIQVLGRMVETPEDLYRALSEFLADDARPSPVIDYTVFRRRVVISLLRDLDAMRDPADRFDELDLRLALEAPEGFEFVSWSRFTTHEEEIDLGTISLKRSAQTKLGLEGEGGAAGVGLAGSLQQTFSSARAEEVKLTERRVELAGALSAREARLYQKGARNIDLTGTFAVDLTVRAPADDGGNEIVIFEKLRDNGEWLAPDALIFDRKRLKLPSTCVPASLVLLGSYRVRRVTRNHGTLAEGDDEAVYVKQDIRSDARPLLVSADDLAVFAWRIVDPEGYELELQGLGPPNDPDRSGALYFRSPDEAFEFMSWLRETRSVAVRGRALALMTAGLALRPLQQGDIARLAVESLSLNGCDS